MMAFFRPALVQWLCWLFFLLTSVLKVYPRPHRPLPKSRFQIGDIVSFSSPTSTSKDEDDNFSPKAATIRIVGLVYNHPEWKIYGWVYCCKFLYEVPLRDFGHSSWMHESDFEEYDCVRCIRSN